MQTALDSTAPLASPTFTGTVNGITSSMVGLGNVDNTSDANKPVSTATQTALDGKASSSHNHIIGDITSLQTTLDNKQPVGNYLTSSSLDSEISTDLVAGIGVSLTYDSINDDLSISTNGLSPVLSRGLLAGINAVNYGADRTIQTITLDGRATTFSKGTGWPTTSLSCDVVLKITTTAITSITWTIITDWFNQPPAGALQLGTHLVLLRAIGASTIEGHYIGSKTN
jgi:hypothetical protein